MMSSRTPPDGGYGWVVVMSAFFIMGLTAAVLKNFGLFFLDIQSHFGVLTSTTSLVTSTTIAIFHLGGKYMVFSLKFLVVFNSRLFYLVFSLSLSAPVASVLTLQFSQRVVIIVGGLLSASGMLLASLDLSLPWLYLTMGILQGSTLRT